MEQINYSEYQPLYDATSVETTNGADFSTKMPEEYKWIAMIDRLTDGDITKHDMVYDQNWRSTLYLLSYWAVRDKVNSIKNKTT